MKTLKSIISEKLKLGKDTKVAISDIHGTIEEFCKQNNCELTRYNRTSEVEECNIKFTENSDILNTIISNINKLVKKSAKDDLEKCFDYLYKTYDLDEDIIVYFKKQFYNKKQVNVFVLEDNKRASLSKRSVVINFLGHKNHINLTTRIKYRINLENVITGLLNYLLYEV